MTSGLLKIIRGWAFWQSLRIKYRISYEKVVLVLTGDNEGIDVACIDYVQEFIKRKYAKEAVIFCSKEYYEKRYANVRSDANLRIYCMESEEMMLLYGFYEFMKFFDNIVFTYTDSPKDNYLGRYLKETEITAEEAACLALYHLRYVPQIEA